MKDLGGQGASQPASQSAASLPPIDPHQSRLERNFVSQQRFFPASSFFSSRRTLFPPVVVRKALVPPDRDGDGAWFYPCLSSQFSPPVAFLSMIWCLCNFISPIVQTGTPGNRLSVRSCIIICRKIRKSGPLISQERNQSPGPSRVSGAPPASRACGPEGIL